MQNDQGLRDMELHKKVDLLRGATKSGAKPFYGG
jgi:hypothetical protein